MAAGRLAEPAEQGVPSEDDSAPNLPPIVSDPGQEEKGPGTTQLSRWASYLKEKKRYCSLLEPIQMTHFLKSHMNLLLKIAGMLGLASMASLSSPGPSPLPAHRILFHQLPFDTSNWAGSLVTKPRAWPAAPPGPQAGPTFMQAKKTQSQQAPKTFASSN